MTAIYIMRDGYYSEEMTGIFLDRSLAELHAAAGGWKVEEFEIMTDVVQEVKDGLRFYSVHTGRRKDAVRHACLENFLNFPDERNRVGISKHKNPYHQSMVIRVWAHNEDEALEIAEEIRKPYIVTEP